MSHLRDEDGELIKWKGDLHPDLLNTFATPKCDNKVSYGSFCDKHGGVIACSVSLQRKEQNSCTYHTTKDQYCAACNGGYL